MAGMNRNEWRETGSGKREAHGLAPGDSPNANFPASTGPDTDARMARIMLLQQAIADGTYRIPARAVAEKMVDNLLRKEKPPTSRTRGNA